MEKNSYTFTVNGRELKDFEFIMGPMFGLSIPAPPRRPEEFIKAAYEGGALPIVAPRESGKTARNIYIEDIKKIRQGMGDRRFGVNLVAISRESEEFIQDFKNLGDEGPDFFDINGIELSFNEFLPLLKDISNPILLGFHQPISVYSFLKLLQQKEYSFLVDRFAAGTLKLYLPRSKGGGHLPALKKDQLEDGWDDLLLREVLNIEKTFSVPVPFIIEKGMINVDDFVSTIRKFSDYPSFCGVRFASMMLLTKECPLTEDVKGLLGQMIKKQQKDMLLPIRSVLATVKRGKKLRGGAFTYFAATKFARMVYESQCGDENFPRFSRPYSEELYQYQKDRNSGKNLCHSCQKNCAREFCEMSGTENATNPDANIEDTLISVSPGIFDIDPDHIGASAADVAHNVIQKTLSHFEVNEAHLVDTAYIANTANIMYGTNAMNAANAMDAFTTVNTATELKTERRKGERRKTERRKIDAVHLMNTERRGQDRRSSVRI